MQRLIPFASIIGWLFTLMFLGACSNSGQHLSDTFYCPAGSHLIDGQCVPIQSDGDRSETDNDLFPSPGPDGDLDLDAPSNGENEEDAFSGDLDGDFDKVDASTEAEEESLISDWPRLLLVAPSVLAQGSTSGLRVRLDQGNNTDLEDVTDEATFTNYHPEIVTLQPEPARITGKANGEAVLRAAYNDLVSDPATVRVRPREQVEARGLWVNRWAFSNAADVVAIMEKASQTRFNQVYFQVRGVFDAYYDSDLEPWAQRLSGVLGQDPGWDPLQTAIDEAHARGLELHAWINVFTLWDGSAKPKESTPRHMLLEHPEWVMQDSDHVPMVVGNGYVWGTPASEALRAHNAAVVHDIGSRYDVDGIHLDRVRYPAIQYSHDPVSEAAYQTHLAAHPETDYADWQRLQVVEQVGDIYTTLEQVAPSVALSAAVAGIYQDEWGWGGVTEGYVHWYQDWRKFDELGIIDALIPMVYWRCRDTYAAWTDFRALVDSHAALTRRFLYIGSDMDAGQDAERGEWRGYESWEQVESQILHTRQADVEGWVLYDYGTLNSTDYWDELAAGPFAEPAVVPFMWWKN